MIYLHDNSFNLDVSIFIYFNSSLDEEIVQLLNYRNQPTNSYPLIWVNYALICKIKLILSIKNISHEE